MKLFKKTLCSMVAASIVPISLVGCGQESPSAFKTAMQDTTALYGMRGTDHSWPGNISENSVFAENKLQKNFYIIFDGSGSMAEASCENDGAKINVAQKAIRTFFDNLARDVNVGMYIFDSQGRREAVSLGQNDPASLKRAIQTVSTGSGTPLGEALRKGYSALKSQGIVQQGYGEYHLVVITDGQASDSDLMKDMVRQITNASPVNVHTLGFCIGKDHALNIPGVVNYTSANNAKQLLDGLQNIAAESADFDISSFAGV
ncbi:vWA domain-containing protein [Marinomonas sp. THO17]|uniref:vWA domain-containing protein n=1 Tax=Marinomonas sp. THO17 TaxID=3149048 RepID=UPI00336BFFF5